MPGEVSYLFPNNRRSTILYHHPARNCNNVYLESCNTVLFYRLGICKFIPANDKSSTSYGDLYRDTLLKQLSQVNDNSQETFQQLFRDIAHTSAISRN